MKANWYWRSSAMSPRQKAILCLALMSTTCMVSSAAGCRPICLRLLPAGSTTLLRYSSMVDLAASTEPYREI
ncbi:hypothetical protein EV421DRAFT_1866196 [Armillaria borealis]|uniref:Uncharacterized protein n=1 Tax=Armillaria borealis TaxID=47425 RepID=A0AA39MDI4_9AGAR|nr:hypothetical protein EV421DRAFT_1866196 [Armillaria borealis]